MAPFIAVALCYIATLLILLFVANFGVNVGWVGLLAVIPAVVVASVFRLLSRAEESEDPAGGP